MQLNSIPDNSQSMAPHWAVTDAKVNAVVRRLIDVAEPEQIYLFGSYVRGETTRDSDLDVLVLVSDNVSNTFAESERLRDAVGDIEMPMDVLVERVGRFEELKNQVGLIFREVAVHGRVVFDAGRINAWRKLRCSGRSR